MRAFILIATVALTGCTYVHESETPTHTSVAKKSHWSEEFQVTSKVEEPGTSLHPRPKHLPDPCGLYCTFYYAPQEATPGVYATPPPP